MDGSLSIPWWVIVFFVIGVYAFSIKILQLFLALGRNLEAPEPSEIPPVDDPRFLEAIAVAVDTGVGQGGTVTLLNNGDAFYPALLQAIEEAESSIHLMTYIWRPGFISDTILEALIRRAREGVEVRVMVDGLGSFKSPRKQFEALGRAGGEVKVFNPLLSARLMHINERNHRRALVIDGKIGFAGGMSVAEQWTGHAQDPEHWRDTMIRVTGPMARNVQTAFTQLWTNLDGELLVGPGYIYPVEKEDGPRFVGIVHTPGPTALPLRNFLWFTLQAARRSIYITNAYFAPDRFIQDMLMDKARNGLDVRLLLPGRHTDNVFVRWCGHLLFERFLEAGIRIYEYQPTLVHTKQLVVDERWSVVGSANIDIRSVMVNQEYVLGILDEDLGRTLKQTFFEDLEQAREITPEAWRRRPLWFRARERAAGLFKGVF